MADLPILFSAPMVRAILREIEQPGTGKTQTRRVLPDQPVDGARFHGFERDGQALFAKGFTYGKQRLRYRTGDRLWVRERATRFDKGTCDQHIWFAAGRNEIYPWLALHFPGLDPDAPWPHPEGPGGGAPYSIPSIHMPRWASRITLIVTDVRVQRLQEIDEVDSRAEGVRDGYGDPYHEWEALSYRRRFNLLWDHLNFARGYGWDANPWVAAYTFRPILGNIDQVRP